MKQYEGAEMTNNRKMVLLQVRKVQVAFLWEHESHFLIVQLLL